MWPWELVGGGRGALFQHTNAFWGLNKRSQGGWPRLEPTALRGPRRATRRPATNSVGERASVSDSSESLRTTSAFAMTKYCEVGSSRSEKCRRKPRRPTRCWAGWCWADGGRSHVEFPRAQCAVRRGLRRRGCWRRRWHPRQRRQMFGDKTPRVRVSSVCASRRRTDFERVVVKQ